MPHFKISKKWIGAIVLSKIIKIVIIFAIAFFAQGSENANAFNTPETLAKQAYLVDFETGQVLFSKDAHTRMPTSSMSKVITTYVVFDAIKKGNITLDSKFLVSEKAWQKGGSKMFVPLNKKVAVSDLLKGVIVQSGNDATIVLAEGMSGSEGAFANLLNATAKDLGMTKSNFVNASGWPDPNHYSTAQDLVTLADALIRNHQEHYSMYSIPEFEFNGINQPNRNPLLYKDISADGIKTGHTEAGGYGLMASAVNKDGRRILMVLNGMASKADRSTESTKMMQWALSQFKNVNFANAGEVIVDTPILYGRSKTLPTGVTEATRITIPSFAGKDDIKRDIQINPNLTAPIKKGDVVGKAVIFYETKQLTEIPIVALTDVKESNPVVKFFQKIKQAI